MGVVGSSGLKINFNRSNLFYFAGESVQGDVSFQNSQDKLTVDAIFLECLGDVAFVSNTVREVQDANGNTKKEAQTENVTHTFMNVRIPVALPQYGQRDITLYRGQHSWPFQFMLPDNLPPNLPQAGSNSASVKYYVRIVIDQPWYKPNTQQFYNLTIFPHVNILYTPGGQQPVAFQNQNRLKIRLHGYLIRGGVVPGDKLSLHIDIQNPKHGVIKKIEATLTQNRQIGPSNDTAMIFRTDIPDIRDFSDSALQKSFDLAVPNISLPPTHTYLIQSNRGPLGVVVHYTLTLDVRVRGLFADFRITSPVIIGTEPMSAQQQQQQQPEVNVPIEMPVASAPVMVYDEPPPSYDSIVTTEKI